MAQQRRLEQQLKAGIRAAQQGNKDEARGILEEVVKQSPNNEVAWIWLASVMTTTAARRVCLERVLKINPNNERARQALNRLVGVGGDSTQSLDIERIAAAAQQPARQQERPQRGQPAQPQRRRRRRPSNRQLQVVLGVVAVALVIALVVTLQPQIESLLAGPPTATATPTQTQIAALPTQPPLPTATLDPLAPTPTFSGLIVTRQVLPTDTPTATLTPTETPLPTATLPPPTTYTLLFVGESLTGDDTALYRAVGANAAERLIDDVVAFAYDPNQQRIAAVRQTAPALAEDGTPVGGGVTLFTALLSNPDQQTPLVNLANATISQITFSPNGEQLVYASDVDGDTELYLYDLNGDTTLQLTDNDAADDFPSWSPDGTQLVFSTNRDTGDLRKLHYYVFGANLSDGEVFELTGNRGDHLMARWSPDGSEILYTTLDDGNSSVVLIDNVGTRFRDLTATEPGNDMAPAWSPDGIYVFYVSQQETENFQVYSVIAQGSRPVRVTNNTLNIRQVHVLPN